MLRGLILSLCLFVPTVFALVATFQEGSWPESWPAELEPWRKQARTFDVGHGIIERVYEISFQTPEQFAAAWPAILKVKSLGAPVILEASPFKCPSSFSQTAAGVVILAPSEGYAIDPEMRLSDDPKELLKTTRSEMDKWVQDGKALHAGPPWPKELYSATGELPEYVEAAKVDGRMKWIPATKHPLGAKHRARIDIVLVVDEKIVDLNRIKPPADTPILDHRLNPPGNPQDKP